jgi:methylmalonyl-CoA carboxyltransferase large subunit
MARLSELEDRVRKLEAERDAALAAASFAAAPAVKKPAAATIADAPPGATEEVSEEILSVISAAVAAFLGLRVRVRQVRLRHSEAWAQQGRVSIMASHRWAIQR